MRRIISCTRNKRVQIFGCFILLILIGYLNTIHHLLRVYPKPSDNKSDFHNSDDIDVVYTWVNGSDEKFIESIQKYIGKIDYARYDNRDELKFSIRSLEKFSPWVGHIYIVTNGQIPTWLNMDYEKVSVIPHDQIAQDPEMLPTFSSNIIEQFIHRIPNLSKRFLYLNDDIFLGEDLYPEDFYTTTGGFKIVTEVKTTDCALYCPWSQLKDGICDKECNVPECEFDGNDCIEGNEIRETEHKNITDMFIISLTNTSKMFNLAYGLKRRRYLPHIGFLFDKDIMEEMLMKFHKEFNSTRYNRLRSTNDMQVGFSYYQYLMSERRMVSADEIFDRFDLDKSETWSEDEIHLVLEALDPLNKTSERYFKDLISNCFKNESYAMDADYIEGPLSKNSTILKITRNVVTKCSPLNDTLIKAFSKEHKYHFQHNKTGVAISRLTLLPANMELVKKYLYDARNGLKKFNCIGDFGYMRYNSPSKMRQKMEALHIFYSDLFPNRSKLELPESGRNPYRYYDEYLEWKTSQQIKSIFNVTLTSLLIIIMLLFVLKIKTSRKLSSGKTILLNYYK